FRGGIFKTIIQMGMVQHIHHLGFHDILDFHKIIDQIIFAHVTENTDLELVVMPMEVFTFSMVLGQKMRSGEFKSFRDEKLGHRSKKCLNGSGSRHFWKGFMRREVQASSRGLLWQ